MVDWMPFLNDGYPEEWVQTLRALEKYDFTHMILGHGEVVLKEHLDVLQGIFDGPHCRVKKAATDGASVEEMRKAIGDQLAPSTNRACPNTRWDGIATASGQISKSCIKKWSRKDSGKAARPSRSYAILVARMSGRQNWL